MQKHTLISALALGLSLGLAGCGGGGGSSGPQAPAPSGGDSGGNAGGDGGGGTGGGEDTGSQTGDYARYYSGLGVMPAGLPAGLTADPAVEDAVAPAYLVLAGLQAATDVRMNMQAFEWAVPSLVRRAVQDNGTLQEGQTYLVSCDLRGDAEAGNYAGTGTATVFYGGAYADGTVSAGDDVAMALGNCEPAGGMLGMQSAQPQSFIAGENQFALTELEVERYGGLLFGTSGLFERRNLPDYIACDAEPRCAQMQFDNTVGGASSDMTIAQAGTQDPLRLTIWSDGATATAGEVETYVEPSRSAMVFIAPRLDFSFSPGAAGEADTAGHYRFGTADGGVTFQYSQRTFALATFRLLDGGFSVTAPDGTVYTYAVDADPLYLNVGVDRNGDGEADSQGRIAQALVAQRLQLAQ